jgi:hypothetical protein
MDVHQIYVVGVLGLLTNWYKSTEFIERAEPRARLLGECSVLSRIVGAPCFLCYLPCN